MSNIQKRSKLKYTDNVFLFIPNIIGYARIVLASLSLYYMKWHPKVCVTLYGISCLLDAVDGNAARYFDQCSKFGAVLDMVTDSSHYMHMYSSMTAGSTSHKKLSESDYKFLHLYYNSSTVLFIMCAGNELFFVTLYFLQFLDEPSAAWNILLGVSGIICFAKQFINVVQIVNASKVLANVDKEERKALSASKEK
ncbi:CDP-alcohol phosphatidyltransferase-domain-containing protein [Phascolomyces articulosus]|uniref:CDP-diacylglycerol--inositol 3-phosphatidyltransferase n=1 Tax=Phascolomyces articulosus TaxID=60185 RepID=A0AAD5PKC0_9FUNG|nr:CDP-alcohol phosphatidyltransferase-domain-containing protein [Phascolomyces articulosus]